MIEIRRRSENINFPTRVVLSILLIRFVLIAFPAIGLMDKVSPKGEMDESWL